MKNLFLTSGVMLLMLCGCNGGQSAGQAAETARQDSIKEAARQDSIRLATEKARQDSIMAKAEESFDNPVMITTGKSTHSFYDESSVGVAKMQITLTNNTPVTLGPADYRITYMYPSETTKGGEIVDITASGSSDGPALPAGSSVDFQISQKNTTGKITGPAVKLKITKEEFLKRLTSE